MTRKFSPCRFASMLAMWLSAFIPQTSHAASATLTIDAELRAERYIDAAVLVRLAKGTTVETLKPEAGWVQVRIGTRVGWLRASQLSGSEALHLKKMEDGRSGPGNVMAISGIRSMPPAPPHAGTALSDIHSQRDLRHTVSVTLRNPILSIGKDALDFSVTSSHDGYLYLILLGSDNRSFYMLFPNDLDQDNAIKAGQALRLPRKKWEIKAQGPAGTNRMLAIVTASPRPLGDSRKDKEAPFLTILTDAGGQPQLQWLLQPSATNSGTYGSALIEIVEK